MDRRTFLGAAAATAVASGLHAIPTFADADKAKAETYGSWVFSSAPMARLRPPSSAFTIWVSRTAFCRSMATSASSRRMRRSRSATCWRNTTWWRRRSKSWARHRLVWNFLQGPSTIGLVPPKTRSARIDALRQVSDFAKLLGIGQVQTHCGFIPENPADALYPGAVEAIRTVAQHCQGNGQHFLMETGQETPTTMSRAIRDVNMPNLGVGLDTANLILYGKANPVDAVDIIGTARAQRACQGRQVADRSEPTW